MCTSLWFKVFQVLLEDKIVSSPSGNYTSITDNVQSPTEQLEKEKNILKRQTSIDASDCIKKDGETFCTELRNYPEKSHLKELIETKYPHLESNFDKDVTPTNFKSRRLNLEPDEEFLCKSHIKVIYPESGVNENLDWMVIVNIPEYKQGIRIEECDSEGSECGDEFGMTLPSTYTTHCKQYYIYRALVAYADDDNIVTEHFKFPACCKCVIRSDIYYEYDNEY
ncbi:protein spaetzle-like [Calliphora vicina]|uniref:protein spaetzle-like n=1 Tax=Calliphora vicina TaxID=7373 RepID=UPI00325A9A8C